MDINTITGDLAMGFPFLFGRAFIEVALVERVAGDGVEFPFLLGGAFIEAPPALFPLMA